METLFVSREARLKRRENTLSIAVNGRTKFFPVEKIRHIVLLSEGTMNSSLLCLCGAHGVRISVFDYYGYFKGAFEPIAKNPSGRVKLRQAEFILNERERMIIAREIVRGAAQNMLANLLYYRYRGKTELKDIVREMNRILPRIDKNDNPASLMGAEGNLHQFYYRGWKSVDPKLDFGTRVRRPPNNPVNCLISFLNQMVYTVVRHEIFKTHLDETLSFLHAAGSGRSSLSLDLSEPFKPVLADTLIFKMVRKRMMQDNWFEQHDGVCLLTETGRRHVAEQFSARLEEVSNGRSYREWIYREALNIERHILEVKEYESFKRKV
ncbi:CRISPR-associated endonuclease Cas1 [Desulfococcaceae bacterium HSG8]|nr:CRISPR-associated endonuclease Cas1 [Desulfococcaceae bacterium HSG8]